MPSRPVPTTLRQVAGAIVLVLSAILAINGLVGAGSVTAYAAIDPEPGATAHTHFKSDPGTNMMLKVRTPTTYSADPHASELVVRPERGPVKVSFVVRRGAQELSHTEGTARPGQVLRLTATRWRVSAKVQSDPGG